jgi:hypothetical protein
MRRTRRWVDRKHLRWESRRAKEARAGLFGSCSCLLLLPTAPGPWYSAARNCPYHIKRFRSRRDLLRERIIRRLVRYIFAARKESQERSTFSRDVLENCSSQHRILCLKRIEDRSPSHFATNVNGDVATNSCKCAQVRRHYDSNHENVWTSTESTAGRSRTIGVHVSPESADA